MCFFFETGENWDRVDVHVRVKKQVRGVNWVCYWGLAWSWERQELSFSSEGSGCSGSPIRGLAGWWSSWTWTRHCCGGVKTEWKVI
jgi:hypothetical protein